MAKRRPWLADALVLLTERGYSSSELAEVLGRKHRYGPDAREITLILKRDPRFVVLIETPAASLMRSKSHIIPVFGLATHNYKITHPYPAQRDAEN
jgi:hypothetical protein